jgi:hypothetical protein
MHIGFVRENSSAEKTLKIQNLDERVILKWFFTKGDWRAWTEPGYDPSGSVNSSGLLICLNSCLLLMISSAFTVAKTYQSHFDTRN